MSNRTRTNEIKLFLSDDERYIFEEKWKLSGMKSRSAFLRHLIIYGFVYDVNYDELKEYSRQLNAIGNNINQIVKLCNKTGHVYENDIKKIRELMKEVWRTHESTLSRQPYISQ